MSAPTPVFTSAPRLKIKIGGVTIGFAIGMNVNISVNQQPVQILGQFGPVSIEPTMYNVVTGTMQIIRLASSVDYSDAAAYFTANPGILGGSALTEVLDDAGSGTDVVENAVSALDSNNPVAQPGLIRHLDPRSVLLSRTFDLNLHMKVPNAAGADANPLVAPLVDNNFGNDPIPTLEQAQTLFKDVPWMTIKDCRLTSRNVNIAIGQLTNEPVSFQGLLATSHKASDEAEIMQRD